MKRIYMAGVGGMLGSAFYHEFRDAYDLKCSDIDVNDSWLQHLDFRDRTKYRDAVIEFGADAIFHIGALTDLEYCEKNINNTYSTNALAVENAVSISNELDIPIVYISTAGIFDGLKNEYDDWDVPNPLCHYARSKYAGELSVVNGARRHMVCRAGWMMGGGPNKDKKFVQKIMTQIKSGASELNIVNDKNGTPTYTVDFAKNVRALFENEYWGLYNMVCEGVTGRLEVANELISCLGLSSQIKINEVDSSFFKSSYFAPRPPSERLVCKKLELRDCYLMRDWKVCLEEYLNTSYHDFL